MTQQLTGLEQRLRALEQRVTALEAELEGPAEPHGGDPRSRARRAEQLREQWLSGPTDPADLVETADQRRARQGE